MKRLTKATPKKQATPKALRIFMFLTERMDLTGIRGGTIPRAPDFMSHLDLDIMIPGDGVVRPGMGGMIRGVDTAIIMPIPGHAITTAGILLTIQAIAPPRRL
jgi:hypothetical protein